MLTGNKIMEFCSTTPF